MSKPISMRGTLMSTRKKVIFALLATVVGLFGLEFGFRGVVALTSDRLPGMIDQYRARWYPNDVASLAYRPHPYFGYVRRDGGPTDGINSLGFWGPELDVEKPPNTLRIVALGGSTTAGPLAWPYQLQTQLSTALKPVGVQVQNLGIGGWTSAEAVAAFAMVGLSYQPDVVVVHCVNNDMEPMRALAPAVDYSHYRRAMNVLQDEVGEARIHKSNQEAFDAVVAGLSDLFVYFKMFRTDALPTRATVHALTTWQGESTAEPSQGAIAIYKRNLTSIAALAEANGATMVVATMPVMKTPRAGMPSLPSGHIKSLEFQNQRLRDFAEEEGWVLADMAAIAPELAPYFEDAIHVDMTGERMKAEVVVQALFEAGVLGDR
jgi:hypothetical protein